MTALNSHERFAERSYAVNCCRQHLRVFYPSWYETQPSAAAHLSPLIFTASNGLSDTNERGMAILIPRWELGQDDAAAALAVSRHFASFRKFAAE